MIKRSLTAGLIVLVLCTWRQPVTARANFDMSKERQGQHVTQGIPEECLAEHHVGKIVLGVSNLGTFGTGFKSGSDCFTSDAVKSCEYPKGSVTQYLFAGAFWIGAVVGRDTLVSHGADGWSRSGQEFWPDEKEFAVIKKRSIIDPNKPEYQDAISEEDFVFVYADTNTAPASGDYFGRDHVPLNIEVTDRSYAWSYAYAEDFILFDYEIRNIGQRPLEDVYMGFYVDADVHAIGRDQGWTDDICGFLETMPIAIGQDTFILPANIAYIIDDNGDLGEKTPVPSVTAMRIVRTPATFLDVSFNWWISNSSPGLDFGPREKPFKGRWKEADRDFRTGGRGTPEGDVNKYYLLRNREFDFDQFRTASISSMDTLWQPCVGSSVPQDLCNTIANGYDTRYLLSFGPFDIDPGQRLPLSFAYVGGEGVHTKFLNDRNLPDNPDAYYANLSFEDLALNSVWASWIYDNPGVDTDGDGWAGPYEIKIRDSTIVDSDCVEDTITDTIICTYDYLKVDTIYLEGDGVPDFRGATPPPAPEVWIESSPGALHVRFNGLRSETTRDVFSRALDFEGYRIYMARDERPASYSVMTSFDLENFNKFIYDGHNWILKDFPFTLDELRCLYADSCTDIFFDPLEFTTLMPFVYSGEWGDSLFYFVTQDYNHSALGVPGAIRKVYPDQPYPSTLIPDSARPEELTPDGYFKYFEYEYDIVDLLPTVPYWVSVTAFDFGSPQSGLPALETSKTVTAKHAYPLSSAQDVLRQGLKVMVYPNPYRLDVGYRTLGFEGRGQGDRSDDYVRAIHFANLPPKCTIRIFTLDGDLVREIDHDVALADPNASHETWNLITRNTQLVASGLYYWTVEEEDGSVQVGKLAIVM
ncbi:MAG TPA: hypothetical protein VN285_07220 [Candidatus Deferrimicrobium sp.]|nr:hypothetical protein [Candidatus Deferrimicrobium sp.]